MPPWNSPQTHSDWQDPGSTPSILREDSNELKKSPCALPRHLGQIRGTSAQLEMSLCFPHCSSRVISAKERAGDLRHLVLSWCLEAEQGLRASQINQQSCLGRFLPALTALKQGCPLDCQAGMEYPLGYPQVGMIW